MASRSANNKRPSSAKGISRREEAQQEQTPGSSVVDDLSPASVESLQGGSNGKSLLTSAATKSNGSVRNSESTDEQEAKEKVELEEALNRRFYLPRLPVESYHGNAVVHWTLTMEQQATGWLTAQFHACFRELMLHAQSREHLICPIYCLMPDHMHLVWMGVQEASDQRNGMAFLRTHLKPLIAPAKFQHQAHDHVLDEGERKQHVFANACNYIAANPVEAGLVQNVGEWEFTGAVVAGYPDLHPVRQSKFWQVFWDVYWKARKGGKI